MRDVGADVEAGVAGARATVGSNIANCSSRLRLRFFCAKVSVARAEDRDVLGAELEGAVEAALVGHQDRAVAAGLAEERHQVGGVGELRHPLRVHEAGRLDDRQAGGERGGGRTRP